MNRVLVIGIDGGTFDLITPWVEAGDLPNLGSMMREGVHGPLTSTRPPVTAPAWTTFATGANPGKHSVFDFIRPIGSQYDLVNASSIRLPTLWHILSESGRTTGTMNVPVTYPPQPVNGFVIGGMLSPMSGSFTYPSDILARYEDHLKPYRIAPTVQYKPGNERAFITDLLELVERRGQYALQLMDDYAYDFLMFHFQASDVIQHALWKFVDPAHPRYDPQAAARFGPGIKTLYQRIDHFIGHMRDRLPGDGTMIVMSDHGFGSLHYVVNMNLYFMKHGLLKLKRGVWTQLKARLFQAGLTPASIWHLIERTGLQNYVWHVSKSTRNKVVSKFLSFDNVDWAHTLAYSIGHVGQIYINLKGREPQGIVEPGEHYQAVRQRVIDTISQLRHPETGQRLVDRIIPSEEVVHGPYAPHSPDLHLVLDGYRTILFPLFATDRRVITRQIRGDSGCHRQHGIFIAHGAAIKSDQTVEDAHIMDLAPTILHLMGLPIPSHMDGRVLTETLTITRPVERQATDTAGPGDYGRLPAEEEAEVEERLRALGYLG